MNIFFKGVKYFVILVFIISIKNAYSQNIKYDIKDPSIIAKIGKEQISGAAFNFVVEQLKNTNSFKSNSEVLNNLINNNLIAKHYLKGKNRKISDGTLKEIENEYLFSIIKILGIKNNNDTSKEAERFITSPKNVDIKTVQSVLFPNDDKKSLSRVFSFDDLIKGDSIHKFAVIKYKFPQDEEKFISLYELIKHQYPHIIAEIRAGNSKFIDDATGQLLTNKYIFYLAENSKPSDREIIKELKKIIEDKYIAREYFISAGIAKTLEMENEEVNKMLLEKAKDVSNGRIMEYYNKNKANFKEVKEVHARHIKIQDEENAKQVNEKLQKGENFTEMVKKYSVAADKNDPDPGRLPVIKKTADLSFLEKICLFQDKGKPSQYMKTPDGYEIVIVDKKIEEYRNPKDKAVIYEISKTLAREDIINTYKKLRLSLLNASDIHINKNLLGGSLDVKK
ncbi:MAG: peptidyl-prolyl cis-trans isomerase [Desulfobacterales bacterium]|nr:peptidyl-prolyl cis-trans isomerase [Desulfobacterales bacterium]